MSEPSPKSLRTAEEAFARYVVARDLVPPISSTLQVKCGLAQQVCGWACQVGRKSVADRRRTCVAAIFDDPPGTAHTAGAARSSNLLVVRQYEPMSWNVHEVAALPAGVDEAYEVVKTRLRIQIAHYLADHPAARIGEIIDAVGSERATVRSNLSALEELGVVSVSLPAGQREAQRVLYTLNRARWIEMVIRVITYLPPAPDE